MQLRGGSGILEPLALKKESYEATLLTKKSRMYELLRYLPKSYLSYAIGHLVHVKVPGPFGKMLVKWFAKRYKIDLDIAERTLAEYATIGELFTRNLKPGARPIEGSFVSPVDGTLRNSGRIEGDKLTQVKGKSYSLSEFLQDEKLAERFRDGFYFNFYLSPQDYHHIHSPSGGKIVESIAIPGALWPVNDWSLNAIDKLFAVNERVVTVLETQMGLVAVVMIGATNVGRIAVEYDNFVSNLNPGERRSVQRREYSLAILVQPGDRLGTFHMGSSVVVLVEKSTSLGDELHFGDNLKVKFGQSLLK